MCDEFFNIASAIEGYRTAAAVDQMVAGEPDAAVSTRKIRLAMKQLMGECSANGCRRSVDGASMYSLAPYGALCSKCQREHDPTMAQAVNKRLGSET